MKMNYKKSFIGSVLAFIIGTSCCWITSLAIWIGGIGTLSIISSFIGDYNYLFFGVSMLLFIYGVYSFYKNKKCTT